jgi:hypothetical protein
MPRQPTDRGDMRSLFNCTVVDRIRLDRSAPRGWVIRVMYGDQEQRWLERMGHHDAKALAWKLRDHYQVPLHHYLDGVSYPVSTRKVES